MGGLSAEEQWLARSDKLLLLIGGCPLNNFVGGSSGVKQTAPRGGVNRKSAMRSPVVVVTGHCFAQPPPADAGPRVLRSPRALTPHKLNACASRREAGEHYSLKFRLTSVPPSGRAPRSPQTRCLEGAMKIGRLAVVTRQGGVASDYDCDICLCPASYDYTTILPGTVCLIWVTVTDQQSAQAWPPNSASRARTTTMRPMTPAAARGADSQATG
jgi:hypothetical protein